MYPVVPALKAVYHGIYAIYVVQFEAHRITTLFNSNIEINSPHAKPKFVQFQYRN